MAAAPAAAAAAAAPAPAAAAPAVGGAAAAAAAAIQAAGGDPADSNVSERFRLFPNMSRTFSEARGCVNESSGVLRTCRKHLNVLEHVL